MMRSMLTFGSCLAAFAGAAATVPEAAACEKTPVEFDQPCPPNGYGNPQPPYDCDYDGDGVDDSWCTPITIPDPSGPGNLPATDSCGNTLSLPCVGDPSGPGDGDDYYRPTWNPDGDDGPGTELGRCLYPCGRNTWNVWVCDSDGDGTPDKFTKSEWTTKNGGRDWPFTGESETFCVPLAMSAVLEDEPMVIVSSEFANGEDFSAGYSIVDVVVLRSYPQDLGRVVVDGQTIDSMRQTTEVEPAPVGAGQDLVVAEVGFTSAAMGASETVARMDGGARVLRFAGSVTNVDTIDHAYEVVLRGRNLSLSSDRLSLEIAAGQTASFEVDAVEVGPGVSALAMMAYSDTFDIDDPVTTVSVVEPATSWSDLDFDGRVSTVDLTMLLNAWGSVDGNHPADLNDDGLVGSEDLAILLSDWTGGE